MINLSTDMSYEMSYELSYELSYDYDYILICFMISDFAITICVKTEYYDQWPR